MTYRTVLYCTSNERRQEQIELEKDGGWVAHIRNIVKKRSFDVDNYRTEVWIYKGGAWYNKVTGEEADFNKTLELCVIKLQAKHLL